MAGESSGQGLALSFRLKHCKLVLDRWNVPSKPWLMILTALSDPMEVASRLFFFFTLLAMMRYFRKGPSQCFTGSK